MCIAASIASRRARPSSMRRRARRCDASSTRPTRVRSSSCATRPRPSTSSPSWGQTFLKAGDEVLITEMEHHANIVPWQLLRDRIGIKLVVAPLDATNGLDMAKFEALVSRRTKLVAVTHVANVTGAVVPVESVVRLAHAKGAKVLLDGCQAAPRLPVDMQALNCDFYVFSGHKAYGPTGIGVLYGKKALLDAMPPWQGGGDMIVEVTFAKTTFQEPPHRFEAGTPDISGAIGLGIALDYL